MNSMSKDCHQPCKKEVKDPRHCQPIISCGNSSCSTIIPTGTPVGTNYNIASVKVNTSSLCNPVTKLEFSSYITSTGTGTLSFQVSKVCKGGLPSENVGVPFILPITATTNTTFSFTIADCKHCLDDCCVYTVTATVTTATGTGPITISNPTLLATSSCGSTPCC